MRILILAPPGVQSLDVVGPAEVFWEAARRLGDENAYRIEIVGTQAGPIPGTGSLRFLPDRTIDEPDIEADTLLVGGDPRLPPDVDRQGDGLDRANSPPGPSLWIDLHRRLLSRRRRAAGRPAGHDTLGVCRRTGGTLPEGTRGIGPHLHQGRFAVHGRGCQRRHGSGACAGRRGFRSRAGARRRPVHGPVPEASRRAVAVLDASRGAVDRTSLRSRRCSSGSWVTSIRRPRSRRWRSTPR